MRAEHDHRACVDAWIERAAKGLPPEGVVGAFERGFSALWGRAYQTLGDVTLTAIVGRALFTAAEHYPFLSVLEVDISGLRVHRLREAGGGASPDRLAEGLRFMLVEFLTVIGNLTADILTPSLHAALSAVEREGSGDGEDEKP